MKARRYIDTPDDWTRFLAFMADYPRPCTISVTPGGKRTTDQNSLLHQWFGEISAWHGDLTANEVKGICHKEWALDIKKRDPAWAWVWAKTGERLPYEKQCKLLASGALSVSSTMTTKELSEYMDAMSLHYRAEGVALTDPEARKYEGVK